MGIKRWTLFMRNHFAHVMHRMPKNVRVSDLNNGKGFSVDNLMIDMNGVFHNSAQKIYEYGNHKPSKRLLKGCKSTVRGKGGLKKQIEMFAHVCKTVEDILDLVQPTRRLILCVDGTAPLSKQMNQRQRRFKSADEASKNEDKSGKSAPFQTSSITPGTKFMDYLNKYVDWYIRKRITESDKWQKLEVVFSNEKAPGEGEHNCISFIRKHCTPDESFCINGLDADLFMLALGTHMPKFFILREDLYDYKNEYHFIDIGSMRGDLSDLVSWKGPNTLPYDEKTAIDDFIMICFMVGNDFLPHIPSIEIIEDGIELMIEVYKNVGSQYGHLTSSKSGKVLFLPHVLGHFLGELGRYEKQNFQNKLNSKKRFFKDELLLACSTQEKGEGKTKGKWIVDVEKYNNIYHANNFGKDIKKVCHNYFEGMQWVLSYYKRGVPNWRWLFPYQYAPSASVLSKYINTFTVPNYGRTSPTTPFQQLLCVLPPKCAYLIPSPLSTLLTDDTSPLKKFCPKEIKIDLSGKMREWEGIVLLPIVNFNTVLKSYFSLIDKVNQQDLKRNIIGRSHIYIYNKRINNTFKSYYGDIENCSVKTFPIDL